MAQRVTLDQFRGIVSKLPPQVEAAAIRGLRSAALRGVGKVVQEIDHAEPYPAVNNGGLRQSVRTEPVPRGAILSVDAPQAAWMEFGTRPHMPPLGPILAWVVRKFKLGMSGPKQRRKRPKKAAKLGPQPPPQQGPKAPPRQGPKLSKFHRQQRRSMRFAARQQQDMENLQKALAIAQKVRWKIKHHGTAPRGFFAKAMVIIRTKYVPQEIRREMRALEKRL